MWSLLSLCGIKLAIVEEDPDFIISKLFRDSLPFGIFTDEDKFNVKVEPRVTNYWQIIKKSC